MSEIRRRYVLGMSVYVGVCRELCIKTVVIVKGGIIELIQAFK